MVAFVQFKKREKHLWRSVNFSKVAGFQEKISVFGHFSRSEQVTFDLESLNLKTIKTKIWEKWPPAKIWSDLLENVHTSQFESAECESAFKDFMSKI